MVQCTASQGLLERERGIEGTLQRSGAIARSFGLSSTIVGSQNLNPSFRAGGPYTYKPLSGLFVHFLSSTYLLDVLSVTMHLKYVYD